MNADWATGMKQLVIVFFILALFTVNALAATVEIKDVSVSEIKLLVESALPVGGTQTVIVTIRNDSGSPATGDLKIEITGPNSGNTASYFLGGRVFPIGTTDFTVTFGPGAMVLLPFDKTGAYKASAVVSNISAGIPEPDPIKANNAAEEFFFVAAERQNSIPETGIAAMALIITALLYITRSCRRK